MLTMRSSNRCLRSGVVAMRVEISVSATGVSGCCSAASLPAPEARVSWLLAAPLQQLNDARLIGWLGSWVISLGTRRQ